MIKEAENGLIEACNKAKKQFNLPSKTKLNINVKQVTVRIF